MAKGGLLIEALAPVDDDASIGSEEDDAPGRSGSRAAEQLIAEVQDKMLELRRLLSEIG